MAKKLKISDIRKNSVLQVSHSINKIKENEKKYTIILVIIFNIIFIIIGYCSLTVHDNKSLNNNNTIYSTNNLTSYSKTVNLNYLDTINDDEGKKRNNYPIEIVNETTKEISYKITFKYDEDIIDKCGCQNKTIDYKDIRYSLDGENVNQFTNEEYMLISEDVIPAQEKKIINISMWLNEKIEQKENHLHGHFIIEKE